MLNSNGYDIEVIDADNVVLPGDYPAQNRTNRRILQLHDIWHLVGGYGFTGAGEVAISGFQMAQFGQNYSTRFLATVATKVGNHTTRSARSVQIPEDCTGHRIHKFGKADACLIANNSDL